MFYKDQYKENISLILKIFINPYNPYKSLKIYSMYICSLLIYVYSIQVFYKILKSYMET